MRFLNREFISNLSWIVIGLYIIIKAFSYFLDIQNSPLQSKKSSPDGDRTIFEFQDLSESKDHAPYGKLLSLSDNDNIQHPNDGLVIFAGYCYPLEYLWISERNILITCYSRDGKAIKTQSIFAHGIQISVKTVEIKNKILNLNSK